MKTINTLNTMNCVKEVDICCGLAWGDEAKGKVVTELIKKYDYDWVCRWAGGSNAGHTIYFNHIKYNTNIVPSGVFYNKKCYIGPQCYVNLHDLDKEMEYLHNNGFNIDTIYLSEYAHVVLDKHKFDDCQNYKTQQGSTGKGIAPCAQDKYGRKGLRVKDILNEPFYFKDLLFFNPEKHIMKEALYGTILCEGAQGFWLDIDYGNYPYVTSSCTLPYSACSLGFPPQCIRHIYGAAKIYDTRVGVDPDFSDDLLKDKVLNSIATVGNEFGTTTGRMRKVNWLDLGKLIQAIIISGTTHVVISKTDILEKVGTFKLSNEMEFPTLETMKTYIVNQIKSQCVLVKKIIFSDNPETVVF